MEAFQTRYMAATLETASRAALTLVAVSADAERLGYIHAHPGKDGVTDGSCGHIAIIALKEDAEGHGVAGKLMQRAELWAKAKGYRLLSLDVFADNRRALEFYLRGGFRPESILTREAFSEQLRQRLMFQTICFQRSTMRGPLITMQERFARSLFIRVRMVAAVAPLLIPDGATCPAGLT